MYYLRTPKVRSIIDFFEKICKSEGNGTIYFHVFKALRENTLALKFYIQER